MYNAISICVFSPDSQFPIDISPVKRDHDFLEKDLVEPLCRWDADSGPVHMCENYPFSFDAFL